MTIRENDLLRALGEIVAYDVAMPLDHHQAAISYGLAIGRMKATANRAIRLYEGARHDQA